MPKGTFLVMIAMAAATGCGFSAAPANTSTPPSTSPPSTFPSTTSTTVPSSTSTTSVYESLGEEVAVSESVLGAMAWRRASSIPAELVLNGGLPGPTHMWTYDWLARYENAREVTGACFEIYEVGAGYLGLGPCPDYWAPEAAWDALRPEWQQNRQWDSAEWIWMREVWSSPDGESWDQTTMDFPDATAAVVALPWVVAEKDGRWVVIGVTGVGEDADIPWDDRTTGRTSRSGEAPV
jgi:hypothetical protein